LSIAGRVGWRRRGDEMCWRRGEECGIGRIGDMLMLREWRSSFFWEIGVGWRFREVIGGVEELDDGLRVFVVKMCVGALDTLGGFEKIER
jgi:hypothetical protein